MKKINAGIIGGAGYTGGEMIRLLLHHEQVNISFIHSRSNAGKFVYEIHTDLIGETELKFTNSSSFGGGWEEAGETELKFTNPSSFGGGLEEVGGETDVLFLCLGHGEAKRFLKKNKIDDKIKIIDLSQDFRLAHNAQLANRNFIYGLPELNKEKITGAQNIANPGCFATAIQLGLLPLAKAGLLQEVYTTGITGSTGAGQSLSNTSHFSWRTNNIQAYKTLTHQHLNEIYQSLNQLQNTFPSLVEESASEVGGSTAPLPNSVGEGPGVRFIPWRGDFARGIFISSTIKCHWPLEKITQLYTNFYTNAPFTFVSEKEISLKQVVNTNKCVIGLGKEGNTLVVHSAIDNLLKGASGQAVQNMNLMFGFDETAGLKLKATAF